MLVKPPRTVTAAVLALITATLAACGNRKDNDPAPVPSPSDGPARVWVAGDFGAALSAFNSITTKDDFPWPLQGTGQCTDHSLPLATEKQVHDVTLFLKSGEIPRLDDKKHPVMEDEVVAHVCSRDGTAAVMVSAQGRIQATGDETKIGYLGNDIQQQNGHKLLQGRIKAAVPTYDNDGRIIGITAFGLDHHSVFNIGQSRLDRVAPPSPDDHGPLTGVIVSDTAKAGLVVVNDEKYAKKYHDSLVAVSPTDSQFVIGLGDPVEVDRLLAAMSKVTELKYLGDGIPCGANLRGVCNTAAFASDVGPLSGLNMTLAFTAANPN